MQVLLKNGHNDIRGNYFTNRNLEEYSTRNIEMIQADVANENAIQNITKDCEVVVHTAARVIDFGTKKQFKSLVEELHKNGIRVMLDAVFNHSGMSK